MQRPSTLQLSLADIARLAKVQRSVASMWRNRPLEGDPFPTPIAVVAGQERFDAFDVADYLTRTGRGNNPEARADLAAHAQFAAPVELDNPTMFGGMSALLCVASTGAEALADHDASGILDRAAEIDPADQFLHREIASLGDHIEPLAAYADDLADASFSAEAALELLIRQHLHRNLAGHSAVALRDEATQLVADVAEALASDAQWDSPLFVDVTDGSADLLLATVSAHKSDPTPSVGTVAFETVEGRLARRRLHAHQVHRVDVGFDPGTLDIRVPSGFDGSIHVLQLPAAAQPTMTDAEILDVIGNIEVHLDQGDRAVVVGPASALIDKLRTEDAEMARDAILRGGRLRAAIRLPKGLILRSPRRALGLWVLGPTHRDVPIAERATIVGDLSPETLMPGLVADLVSDVLTAMASPRMASGRALRRSRLVPTNSLHTGRRALVEGPVTPRGAEWRTLAELVESRYCRAVTGSRIQSADLTAEGRSVVGVAELLGERPLGSRHVDPFTFPTAYPRAHYTEPGDVVFCTSPRIGAWTDHGGGSVVLSPARILRVVHDPERGPAPLLADVIAVDINSRATESRATRSDMKDWRRWPIRLVPPQQLDRLDTALAELRARRGELSLQLIELDRATEALIARYTDRSDSSFNREEGI